MSQRCRVSAEPLQNRVKRAQRTEASKAVARSLAVLALPSARLKTICWLLSKGKGKQKEKGAAPGAAGRQIKCPICDIAHTPRLPCGCVHVCEKCLVR